MASTYLVPELLSLVLPAGLFSYFVPPSPNVFVTYGSLGVARGLQEGYITLVENCCPREWPRLTIPDLTSSLSSSFP